MPAVLSPVRPEYFLNRRSLSDARFFCRIARRCLLIGGGVTSALLSVSLMAQSSLPSAPGTPSSAGAPQQPIAPITETVVVHGDVRDNYLPETVSAGTLDGAPLSETPLAISVVTRDLLSDQVARTLSDVVKNDASVGEDYAPVGYYGDFEIRGFPIDLATGLQINGMTIAGEQDVPLENKERVELLKGIAGVESGVASAGGLINFETKRPAMIKAIDLATDHRGSSFGNVDLGHLFGDAKQVGVRVNLAGERIQTYVQDANGWRGVGAGAADWKMTSRAMLKTDFEYQHKVERSVSGYQLLGGTTVPDLHVVHPSTMLGQQSWSKPNTFDTLNAGTRLDYALGGGWRAFVEGSLQPLADRRQCCVRIRAATTKMSATCPVDLHPGFLRRTDAMTSTTTATPANSVSTLWDGRW